MSGDVGERPPAVAPAEAEHPRDLLASYALGLLAGDEHDRVEAHIRECPTCAPEVQELRAALDALPLSVAPVAPPPAARQALMARVSATVRDAPRAQREVTMATALRPAGWPSSWGAAAGW